MDNVHCVSLVSGPKKAEAIPVLTLGDVRGAMVAILRDGYGKFFISSVSRLVFWPRAYLSCLQGPMLLSIDGLPILLKCAKELIGSYNKRT